MAEQIISKNLVKSRVVYGFCSEENPQLNKLNETGEYIVSYDPIDGSAVIDSNFAIATIFAVWRSKDIIGMSGKDLVGAGVTIYGPRTTTLLYNSQSGKVEELTLLRMGSNRERWIVTNPDLKINKEAKILAPALKTTYDHPVLFEIFEELCIKGFSIRYSGAFAVDCFQLFIKGHGIYVKLDSVTHPSRLHLLYEIFPIAFLVEKAGGKTSDGEKSVLDVVIQGYDQRITFIAGSGEAVDKMVERLKSEVKS
mmetsp:Transcript_866/g.511  ORF Transcript_866/g.511 Transcript_866/m.511 type:complete len:253 (-) Transcript_866:38-796(-)|eukprot:CAMPEP_0202956690 /NCGR_PEP_ID=MMETSP1396-20130829/1182_1 /ASSEMBLY_ACC=CAM_ASM_000872 /TAXON_ID= /ORGANISM="Pseudokeronopsis sp., Strain Brazil" /LENGTH=252 /DNA_ID=CAMNT_0049673823 /DNA_START=189 /DNA_END=947 /DNA_ORIENTATION=+